MTDDLRVLVKFIKMDPRSDWAVKITQFSNNQNGVKARDFKSNNNIQIRLQNEFQKHYGDQYAFEIKQGENGQKGIIISNVNAGLALMAFDLKEPWATHRKYEIFEDKYGAIFGRPEVNADKIVLCEVIMDAINAALPQIENAAFAKYVLTRYMLLYIFREIIDNDPLGPTLLAGPEIFVRKEGNRQAFRKCADRIVNDIVIDLNLEAKEFGENFDYRDKLRDSKWVKERSAAILKDHLKLVARKAIPSFKDDWESVAKSK